MRSAISEVREKSDFCEFLMTCRASIAALRYPFFSALDFCTTATEKQQVKSTSFKLQLLNLFYDSDDFLDLEVNCFQKTVDLFHSTYPINSLFWRLA